MAKRRKGTNFAVNLRASFYVNSLSQKLALTFEALGTEMVGVEKKSEIGFKMVCSCCASFFNIFFLLV